MDAFSEVTLGRVPSAITVPEPLRLLFEWVETSGLVETGQDGELYGSISAGWPNGPGTNLLLRGWRPDEIQQIALWFGPMREGLPTLWPFCRIGGDGSMAALWHAPDGRDLIVHMGSGSGSMLTCVLGNDAVDFLRLIGIGYHEICWTEDWARPPVPKAGRSAVNSAYREWVETTFDTVIPQTGIEVVPAPAEMGDTDTSDLWCQWVNAATS